MMITKFGIEKEGEAGSGEGKKYIQKNYFLIREHVFCKKVRFKPRCSLRACPICSTSWELNSHI